MRVGTIGWAIERMQTGLRVRRSEWPKRQWIAIQASDAETLATVPFVYGRTTQGDIVPWVVTQTDLLGTDWEVVSAG